MNLNFTEIKTLKYKYTHKNSRRRLNLSFKINHFRFEFYSSLKCSNINIYLKINLRWQFQKLYSNCSLVFIMINRYLGNYLLLLKCYLVIIIRVQIISNINSQSFLPVRPHLFFSLSFLIDHTEKDMSIYMHHDLTVLN